MRKQSEKAPAPFFNIGASSLLVIFLILCLVTFAILTLTSAKSDADFAAKLAHHKMNYYAACNTAESTLDEIDAILADAWQLSDTDTSKNSINNDSSQPDSTSNDSSQPDLTSSDTAAVFTEIETQLTALDSREQLQLSMDFTQSEPTISYAVAIDDKQNLCVTLTLAAAPAKGDAYYRISQWQVQSSGEWKGDQTLNLMK
ncbi:MAG: hypothetical protein EGR12_06285 [Coprococcus catus]|nr:hypothetical protein [Coprococcus catus]